MREMHDAATWFMVGLIWMVQVVHYPMFSGLDRELFRRQHALHSTRITWIVLPAMLVELILSAALAWKERAWAPTLGFTFVLGIWAVTFLRMVPLHQQLGRDGFDAETHASLVKWNWLRTAGWTLRGVLALLFI